MMIDGVSLSILGSIAAYMTREAVNHYKVKELKESVKELKHKDAGHEKTLSSILTDNIKITEALDRSFLSRDTGDLRYVGKDEFKQAIESNNKQMLQLNKTLDTKMDILIKAVEKSQRGAV